MSKKSLGFWAILGFMVCIASYIHADVTGKVTTIVSTYQDNAVVKLDSNGDILWATNVGSIVFQAVENPIDKTIYAVGGGIFTKLSRDGAILLQKPISESGSTIDVDPSDGSFYVGTYYAADGINKYDVNGNFIKSFPYTHDSAPAVYRADGSVYVNSYEDGVYKFDKDGNLLWQKEPVEWHNAYCFATLVVDQRDGSVVATTWYTDSIVRLDAAGNTIWTKSIPRIRMLSRNSIDPNENAVYVSSCIYGDTGSTAIYKLNLTDGNTIWSKDIGDGMATVDSFDGSIYVGEIYDKKMTKVDKNSNILWGPKNIGYYIFYLETTSDVNHLPVANAGPDQTVEQTKYQGANVTLDDSGSSDPDGDPLTYKWTWPGGGATGVQPTVSLPLGATTITLIVNDGKVDSAPDTVIVTVRDTTAPVLNCPSDISVEQQNRAGTAVNYTVTATDICDADVTIVCTPPSGTVFPLGETTVNCTATDDSGNSSNCSFKVTVKDTTAPTINLMINPNTLWPPNHKMVKVTTVSATDICDAAPTVNISVTSNEPIDGLGDGDTAPDWEINADGSVWLRAERSGQGTGRIYTITVTATDASGKVATATGTVTVPHDQGKGK